MFTAKGVSVLLPKDLYFTVLAFAMELVTTCKAEWGGHGASLRLCKARCGRWGAAFDCVFLKMHIVFGAAYLISF